jgi:hypothetical protein
MSATHRRRGGYLPVVLLAAVFVLVPRTGAAMRGMGGGGHAPFALGGAGTFGSTFARGAFTSNGVGGGHRFGHRRHGDRGFSPFAYGGFPYYDYGYDPYYADRPASSSERPRGYQHSGYCDVSGKYPQDCVWKDGP